MSKGWIKYAITVAVGLVIAYLVLIARNLWVQTETKEIIEIFCDAIFVAGIMLTGFGLLTVCSSQGAFDGISYLFHIFFVSHNWSRTSFKERKNYGDYIEEKRAKRESGNKLTFILWVGLAFLLVSVILLIVYSNI